MDTSTTSTSSLSCYWSLWRGCSSGWRSGSWRSEWQLYRQRVPQRTPRVRNNPRVFRCRNRHRANQRHWNDLRGHLRPCTFRFVVVFYASMSITVGRIVGSQNFCQNAYHFSFLNQAFEDSRLSPRNKQSRVVRPPTGAATWRTWPNITSSGVP